MIVFNTCSVREKAQEKVFADLGRVKHLKRANPGLMIAVGGCVASQEGGAIVERAPYVDVVFGPQTLHRLPAAARARAAPAAGRRSTSASRRSRSSTICRRRGPTGASAFVSIMEGCSKYCSFCVVPYTRGAEVSRPFDDVVAEIAGLAAQGVKEVTLLGQNVNAWRGEIDGDSRRISPSCCCYVNEIDGIERIRYTTSHPREFTQRLIDAHARAAGARGARAPAGAVGLGPRARGDEARLHRARIPLDRAPPAQGAARASASPPISSSASPARPTPTSRPRSRSRASSSSTAPSPSSTARARARRRRSWRTTPRAEKTRAPAAPAGAAREPGARRQRRAWSARCSACWSKALRGATPASLPRAPPTTAW